MTELLRKPISEWNSNVENDFERSVFKRYPEIERIKQQLYSEGAVFALMSGSGSTVYGIYKEEPAKSFTHQSDYLEVVKQFPLSL